MNQSLINSNPPDNSQNIDAQIALLEFLGKHVQRYTMGDSSSVRVEVAQELLQSICYVLKIDLSGDLRALAPVKQWDLDDHFSQGIKEIQQKIKTGRRLWKSVCLNIPRIENISLHDTIKSIGGFWKKYDYRFFAHDIPCDIDYQLCFPVDERLQGIDYINKYLQSMLIENDFINRFDPGLCVRLLTRHCSDYRGLLINLYEPVAINAIGLAMCGGNIRALDISDPQRAQIAEALSNSENITELLQSSASSACSKLGVRDPFARLYLRQLAANLSPRVTEVSLKGDLGDIFLSL